MDTRTINAGIDLGTTNSKFCIFDGTGPRALKNNENQEITPSVVYIDKKGREYVGAKAVSKLEEDQKTAKKSLNAIWGRKIYFFLKTARRN